MRIVDPTGIPAAIGLALNIAENWQPANRSSALRLVWIVAIKTWLALVVQWFFEPHQLAAQLRPARLDLDRAFGRIIIPNSDFLAGSSSGRVLREGWREEKRQYEWSGEIQRHRSLPTHDKRPHVGGIVKAPMLRKRRNIGIYLKT